MAGPSWKGVRPMAERSDSNEPTPQIPYSAGSSEADSSSAPSVKGSPKSEKASPARVDPPAQSSPSSANGDEGEGQPYGSKLRNEKGERVLKASPKGQVTTGGVGGGFYGGAKMSPVKLSPKVPSFKK
jgi:hypothetical protein